jgi:hypothetical protein
MEPILVPSPPREAFNKNRPISDLIRKQVEHFKHVEEKLPQDIRAMLPQLSIATESDAARYISAMTGYLLTRPVAKNPQTPNLQTPKKIAPVKSSTPIRPTPPLSLAAAAAPAPKKSSAKNKSAPKTETPKAKKSPSIKATAKRSPSKRKK